MPIAEPFSSIKQATSSLPQCCGADTGLHPITTSKLKPLRFLCSPVQESPGGVNGNGHMALKSTALGGGGMGLALGDAHPDLSAHPELFCHFLCAALDSHHTPRGRQNALPVGKRR